MADTAHRATLARWRELHQAADARIRAIYEKRAAWGALQAAHQDKLRCAYATVNAEDRAALAWQRLLNHLGHRTPLLAVEPVVPYLGPQAGNTLLDALLQLALRSSEWLRPLEDRRPI